MGRGAMRLHGCQSIALINQRAVFVVEKITGVLESSQFKVRRRLDYLKTRFEVV
jgi:hypothetical protein